MGGPGERGFEGTSVALLPYIHRVKNGLNELCPSLQDCRYLVESRMNTKKFKKSIVLLIIFHDFIQQFIRILQ